MRKSKTACLYTILSITCTRTLTFSIHPSIELSIDLFRIHLSFSLSLPLSLSRSLSPLSFFLLSLSLSHTHTHTRFYFTRAAGDLEEIATDILFHKHSVARPFIQGTASLASSWLSFSSLFHFFFFSPYRHLFTFTQKRTYMHIYAHTMPSLYLSVFHVLARSFLCFPFIMKPLNLIALLPSSLEHFSDKASEKERLRVKYFLKRKGEGELFHLLVGKAFFGHGCEGPPGLAHGAQGKEERVYSFVKCACVLYCV